MIERIAKKWSLYLIENGADELLVDVYQYALMCLINEIFIDFILLTLAFLMNKVGEMILWIIVFNSLRMNIGGFHARTPALCIFFSVVLGVSNIFVSQYIYLRRETLIMFLLFCIIIIFYIAPIVNDKHPISKRKQKNAKIRGGVFSILSGAYCLLSKTVGTYVCLIAMVSACLLGLIEHIRLNDFYFAQIKKLKWW